MEPIGQVLRSARERKGVTLQEAKRALRINAPYLEALESDDFSRVPAPVYVRAFLREYARYLGLDAEELVKAYSAQAGPEPSNLTIAWTAANEAESGGWGRRVGSVAVFIALGALAVGAYAYHGFQTGKEQAQQGPHTADSQGAHKGHALGRAAGQAAKPPARGAVGSSPSGAPAAGAPGNTPATPLAAEPAQPSATTGVNPPVAGTTPPGSTPATMPWATPQTGGVKVVITASQRCWIRVKQDGQLQEPVTLRPGDKRTWQGTQSVELWAGNAGGIRAVVNGQDQGALGEPGRVIHRRFDAGGAAPPPPAQPALR